MSTDDQALFDATLEGKEPETAAVASGVEQTAQPTAEPTQARDESGRFAAKDETQSEEPALEAAKPEPSIPPGRLREEAEARRRAEAEASELRAQMKMLMERMPVPQDQPKPEQTVPDIFEAPDQWADHRIRSTVDPVMQQMHSVLMHNAKLVASSIHGADKINAAEQAFNEAVKRGDIDPVEHSRIQNNPNPFDAAVKWHERQSLLSEIGTDRSAFEQKIIERFLSDPANRAKVMQQAAPAPAQAGSTIVKLPSSLSRVTSAAPSAPGAEPPVADGELFEQLTGRR